jgi:hypothetical protein
MLVDEIVIFSLLTVNIAAFRRGMNRSEKLIFAVTNDLNYDQRMIRICSSLSRAGYHVTLVGRRLPGSIPLAVMPYHQFRLKCFSTKGSFFIQNSTCGCFSTSSTKKPTWFAPSTSTRSSRVSSFQLSKIYHAFMMHTSFSVK